MTTTKKLLLGLIAVGMAAATPTRAALVTTQGDLLLSFYTVNGSSVGATTYTINLGSGTSFLASPNRGLLININTDLESAFGVNWFDNSELQMSLVGGYNGSIPANGDGARTIYAGSKLTTYTPGTSTPQQVTASSNHRSWATGISGFSDGLNDTVANGATASNSAIIPTSASGDVTDFSSPVTNGLWFSVGNNPSTAFASGNIGGGQEAALDIWRAPYSSSSASLTTSYVTTLSLDNSGNINVVPEPSTVTLLGLAAILGSGLLRRRSRKQS